MSVSWLQYEPRIIGKGAGFGPVLAIAGIGLIGLLMMNSNTPRESMASRLTAMVELTIPLVAGILATSIVASDLAIELQRTVQTRYRTTLIRRIGSVAVWSAIVATIATGVLAAAGYWVVPGSLIVGQLVWLAPMLWFMGVGILLSAALRSWSAAAAFLGGFWLLQNLTEFWFLSREWARPLFVFMTTHQHDADDWLSTRLAIAGAGVLLGAIGLMLKNRSEALDVGGEQ